jgi:hypothetical protein
MDEQTRQLRTEARQLARGKAPRGIRYSVAFRRRAIALVRERARQGVPVAQIVREIGLTTASIARWRQPRPTPMLRPVVLAAEGRPRPAPAAGLVLITRRGLRVEGLDAAGLIAVLRALA